jgi:hypothetical protein
MLRKTLLVALVALAAMASGSAFANGHVHFGVVIGGPLYWPGPYYSSYYSPYYSPYYYPPAVAMPAGPQTYVEQGDERPASAQAPSYWYYCAESKTYYPYVKQCPGGWQRVAPQPPAQ